MRTELHIRGVHLIATDYELTRLLQRLEASGGWAELLATLRVRGEKRCTLVPPVTACRHALCATARRAMASTTRGRAARRTPTSSRATGRGRPS
eukprot:scaffold117096_cov39-Phaeocystis_antarctica.AAC.1